VLTVLGHSHPKFVQAIQAQVQDISVGSFTSKPRVEVFKKLAQHRPAKDVHRVQLYSSGPKPWSLLLDWRSALR
jgi:4-aminobutyrate aminotransferase-like enzyme